MGNHEAQIVRVFLLVACVTLVYMQECNNCVNGVCRRGWDGPTCSRGVYQFTLPTCILYPDKNERFQLQLETQQCRKITSKGCAWHTYLECVSTAWCHEDTGTFYMWYGHQNRPFFDQHTTLNLKRLASWEKENVALDRPTLQSSVYRVYQSRLAVDGDTDQDFSKSTCTHTLENSQPAYWTVTLDAQYDIYRFRIYNRNGICSAGPCGNRLNGFTLYVGNSSHDYRLCYQDNTTGGGSPGLIITGNCSSANPIRGNNVKIMINNSKPLTLCEVQIFVCANGTYGSDCGERCGNCAEGSPVCDTISGHCPQRTPRCMPGYRPPKCDTECTNNTWGADCLEHCGHCYNKSQCNTTNGECPAVVGNPHCAPEYSGSDCSTKCDGQLWGADCAKTCGNCYNGIVCNKTSGECPLTQGNFRCAPGYVQTDKMCTTQCFPGTWGQNCKLTCSLNCVDGPTGCDVRNGACIGGCADGHEGTFCTPVNQNYTGVIIGCVAAVVVIGIVTVVILQVRKRQGNNTEAVTDSSEQVHARKVENSDQGRQATISAPAENNAYENVSENEYDKIRFSNDAPEANYTDLVHN